MEPMGATPRIFISYSHDDEAWKDRVVSQLGVLEHERLLSVWEDRQIAGGDNWLLEIEEAIQSCGVALLLISAKFLTSKFILGTEVPHLLQRREQEGVRVIPVILKPCAWTRVGWLKSIQARPKDGKPLSGMSEHDADAALVALVEEIAKPDRRTTPDVTSPNWHQVYLKRFVNTNRAPEWDPDVLSPGRLHRSQVRIVELRGTHLSAANEDIEQTVGQARTISLARFLDRMLLLSRHTQLFTRFFDWSSCQAFVILGKPAAGKSILSLQLSQLLATRAKSNVRSPIPVYVNLAHFDSHYDLSIDGLERLVVHSIDHDCPRYLPPRNGKEDETISDMVRYLLHDSGLPLMFFLDGIDEMPVADSMVAEHNKRLTAIADFIERYKHHRFLITCRIRDYVTLRDYNHDFQMRLYELLPWTRSMFTHYIESRALENRQGLAVIRDVLRRAHDTDLWGPFAESPMLGALLFGGERLPPSSTLSTAWENFVLAYLRPKCNSDQIYNQIIQELGRFAFARTIEPARAYPLPPEVLEATCQAGLMTPSSPNPEFVIKPLQHYLAALYFWGQIQVNSTEMEDLEIWHPKLRAMFQMVIEIAQDQPVLGEYLIRVAEHADKSQRTKIFERCTECLTNVQFSKNEDLAPKLINLLEELLRSNDTGNLRTAIKGVQKCPNLFLHGKSRSLDLIYGVLIEGSYEGKRRLLHLLFASPKAWFQYLKEIWLLLRFFNSRASLGDEICGLVYSCTDSQTSGWIRRVSWIGLQLLRIVFSAIYVYALYLICFEAAHLLAGTGASLLASRSEAKSLHLEMIPDSLTDLGIRLGFALLIIGIPWMMLRMLSRKGYSFLSAPVRMLVLLGLGTALRFLLLLLGSGSDAVAFVATGLEYFGYGIGLTALAVNAIFWFIAIRQSSQTSGMPLPLMPIPEVDDVLIDRKSSRIITQRPEENTQPSTGGYLAHQLTLAREALNNLPQLGQEILSTIQSWWRWRAMFVVVSVAIVITSYYLSVWRASEVVLSISMVLIFLRNAIWLPRRNYHTTRQRFLAACEGLQADFNEIDNLLQLIADRRVLRGHRMAYIQLLDKEVKWDRNLLARCQALVDAPSTAGESRRLLSEVITRKTQDVDQNANPGWNAEKIDTLFRQTVE